MGRGKPLVGYLVLIVLYHVVGPRAEVEEGVAYYGQHVGGGFLLGGVGRETGTEEAYRLPPEAR